MDILRGVLGLICFVGICYLVSRDRKHIDWRLVGSGIMLQIVLAVLILKVPFVYNGFKFIADGFVALLNYTESGAKFVFGSWPDESIISTMDYSSGDPQQVAYTVGYIFAFKVLPTVVFFSAFSAILYYLGILQYIIKGFAKLMSTTMHLSGAESIAAAANVFIGQTEAPLVVKPFLDNMTKSEIMCLMTGGMATIAGGVFALFVSLLGEEYAIHFLTASIISAPAAIVAAKIIIPERNKDVVDRKIVIPKEKIGNNLLDAISIGTTDGVKLAVNVGAMLLVFIALVALVNGMLMGTGSLIGLNPRIEAWTGGQYDGLSLEYILGLLFSPLAWIMGVPTNESLIVGQLLGKKTTINEVIAYVDMSNLLKLDPNALSSKAKVISLYALCGFSNFASVGIQIGGISSLSPKQRPTLTQLGMLALIGGTIACLMTGTVAGMLYAY